MKFSEEENRRINAILEKAGIAENEKEFWFSRFDAAQEDMALNIIGLFEAFPSEIKWFGEIQKRKEEALSKNDRKSWLEILNEEEKYLTELFSSVKISA